MTAGNKRKSSVPVFLHRPGSRRLASGRIRQNVHNLVSLLPSSITKFWNATSCDVRGWPGGAI